MLSSASKWTAEWNQQFSTWTTCWTLDQHCSPPGTPFPLLWCRHDRIAPERLLVFWRDTQLYGRRGAPKMVTPRPGGGKTEDIEFVAAGGAYATQSRQIVIHDFDAWYVVSSFLQKVWGQNILHILNI